MMHVGTSILVIYLISPPICNVASRVLTAARSCGSTEKKCNWITSSPDDRKLSDNSELSEHRPILSVGQLLNALRKKDEQNCYTPTKEDDIQERLIVRSTHCKKDKENRYEDTTENYDVEKSTIRSRSRSPPTKATRTNVVKRDVEAYGFIRRS